MLIVDDVVEVTAVVAYAAVETRIDVEVVENMPPYGANFKIVESGVL
jgi:hypothetical protein